MRRVAVRALEICHWRSKSGGWTGFDDLDNTDTDCEAGCYRCLLSYSNQPDHERVDRRSRAVLDLLCCLTRATAECGSAEGADAGDAFEVLLNQCGSGLERAWLTCLRDGGYKLPDRAQLLLSEFSTQPDFAYDDTKALVYVDGPHHQQKAIKAMDENRRRALRDAGYKVVVFTEDQSGWPAILAKYPFIFGRGAA
jgi:hypothetical protein